MNITSASNPINWFHLLFVAPLLLYISYVRNFRPLWTNTALIAIGMLIIVYHLYRLRLRGTNLVNLFHVFFVGPLLIYIGMTGNTTPNAVFPVLGVLVALLIVYHAGRLSGLINVNPYVPL